MTVGLYKASSNACRPINNKCLKPMGLYKGSSNACNPINNKCVWWPNQVCLKQTKHLDGV